MIDASLMLQQIQAEQVPDTWHVIRPKSQVRITTLLGPLLLGPLFTVFALGFADTILFNTSNQQFGNSLLDLYIHDPLLAIVAHLAAIGLTIWLTRLLRRHAINLQDAVLVLLPTGIFHGKRLSDENKRSMKFIPYNTIQRIGLKVSKSGEIFDIPIEKKIATFDLNACDPRSLQQREPVPPIFGRFEFHFYDKQGRKATWFPPQVYEKELHEIAQWVLNDYRAFVLQELSKRENHFSRS